MPLSMFRRRPKTKSKSKDTLADTELPLVCATAPGATDRDLQLALADGDDDATDLLPDESHAAKAQRLQLQLSHHSAHYSSDAAKQAKRQRQERYQRLAMADHVLQNPAITVTLAALNRIPGVRHATAFLNVAVKIKNTGQEVYLKFNTVYSKVVALIQLIEDLVDRYSGKAAEALSDTHLNTFWDKMQASSVLFEKVAEEMQKFDDVRAWKQFVQGNVWKRVVDELDMMVDDLLADVHTHASLSGVAQQRRLLTQSSQLTDALAYHAKAIQAHDKFMTVMVEELQDQANTRHKQHLALIDQIRVALAGQNLTMPYFRTLRNPEIANLWAFAFGKAAPAMQPTMPLRTGLPELLQAQYDGTDAHVADAEMRAARMLAQGTLVTFEDLVGVPRGRKILVTKLDDAFPPEAGVGLPQVLCWKVYGWVALVTLQMQSLSALATADAHPALARATRFAQVARRQTLVKWNVDTPTLQYVTHRLRNTVGQSAARSLPAPAQALVDACVALTAHVDAVLAGPAADVDWISEPDSPAFTAYIQEFPKTVAARTNAVVDACERMGLDAETVGKVRMSPDKVAKAQDAARRRATAQMSALEAVLKATGENPAAYPLDAIVADWSEFSPEVDARQRAQHTARGGIQGTLIQLAHVEAERILPRVARVLAALSANPYVAHVLAIVPPNAPAGFPHWGVFLDIDADWIPLELADDEHAPCTELDLTSLAPTRRAALVKQVVLGVQGVHAANARQDLPVYPLGLSPASVVVGRNAMGDVVVRVPPCAGMFAGAGPLDWNRQEYVEFVVPELRSDGRAWVDGVSVDMARRADWWAVGQLVASMFPELDGEERCEMLNGLVGKLCRQENVHDDSGAGVVDVDVEQIVCQVVAIGAEAEKRMSGKPLPKPEQPSTAAATPAPQQAVLAPAAPVPSAAAPTVVALTKSTSLLSARPPTLPSLPPCASLTAAESAYFTARNRIRHATGPVTAPNFDVSDTLALLLAAGDHIPLALVLAADMFYYGAVPRTRDSWASARYLYAKAAVEGRCDYANVGLGDLCLFKLGEEEVQEEEQARAGKALAHYERALQFVDSPLLGLDLTPADRARVYVGLADAYFAQAELSPPARAAELYARAKAHYQLAYERDPKNKRVLAKRALFKIKGLGGEVVDRELGLKDLRAARSRDNPVHELRVRLAVYEIDGDERGAVAVRRMIDMAEVPAH